MGSSARSARCPGASSPGGGLYRPRSPRASPLWQCATRYLGRTSQDSGSGTGAIDHIAFRATGLKAMLAHLRSRGIEFSERRASNQALYQLFLHDPNGIKLELNFDADEAEGLEPEVVAANFVKA